MVRLSKHGATMYLSAFIWFNYHLHVFIFVSSLFKVALRVPIYHRLLVLMVKLNLLGNMVHNICFMCFFLLISVLTV